MADRTNSDRFLIPLKELASQDSLELAELKEIIAFCANFFDQDLPQQFEKSFNLPFSIQGFTGKTFKLIKSNKIENYLNLMAEAGQDQELDPEKKEKTIDELKEQKNQVLENNIFASDLLAFLEQSALPLSKHLKQNNKRALAKLGNDYFRRIGLASKISANQIALSELKKLEDNDDYWQKISNDIGQTLLDVIAEEEKTFEEEKKHDQKKSEAPATAPGLLGKSGATETQVEDQPDTGGTEEDLQQRLPENFSKEFNLARLDDNSKLYIRSLAIVSVNQALNFQFANLSKEQLMNMGFEQVPNFNQLSLESRQQLLGITFSKIESLLIGGQYNLEKLINAPSMRISFAKEVALKVMTDIRGGEIFARELGRLTQSGQDPLELKKHLIANEEQKFRQKLLDAKFSVNGENIPEDLQKQLEELSTEEAEAFFAEIDEKKDLNRDFLANIGVSFTRVTKNNFLGEWTKIIANDKSAVDKAFLVEDNILPVIDVFIQQNYPVEYIENLNWTRFQAHFGRDIIGENTFVANERVIKDLLTCYWKTQRAEWSRSIHQGIDNELYTPEDLEQIWAEFDSVEQTKFDSKDKARKNLSKKDRQILQKQNIYFQQIKHQASYNLIDAEVVSKKLAGFSQDQIDFSRFSSEEIDNLNKLTTVYRQSFLDVINDAGPQAQIVTLHYYLPGEAYPTGNMVLQANTLTQFSPYDLGAINYNQAFGDYENNEYPLYRSLNGEGGIENGLQDGFAAVKNVGNQAMDFVGQKAVRAGLNYATAGAFESLPEPIKQMIEQEAWGRIRKIVEPLLKLMLASAVAAFGALIALALKVLNFFGLGSGAKGAGAALSQNSLFSQAADASATAVNSLLGRGKGAAASTPGALSAEAQSTIGVQAKALNASGLSSATALGKGVMATAGQAVITAFGLVAGGTLFYQTVINSAFLTHFPTDGGGGGGETVYCNGTNVGNLTYYDQRSMNHIRICNGGCWFGNVACGPTSIAMILNEDPEQMSIREGYLGCGKTTCAGSSLGDLISTLNSNGVTANWVTTPTGSPTEITNEISNYLAEGNLLLAHTDTKGFGHYYVIVCVETPGTVTAYDPWWGQNVVHQVGSETVIKNLVLIVN